MKVATPLLGLFAIITLEGCAASSEMIGRSDTQPEYRITCADNPFSHRKDCFDRATELCPGLGYTIIREDEIGRGEMISNWSMTTHELVVRCGG